MSEENKNEMIYLAAYSIIKRMLNEKIITKEAFDRLNKKIAEVQSCKPVLV